MMMMRRFTSILVALTLVTAASVAGAASHDRLHVRDAQRTLALMGLDPGPADGRLGPRTKAALIKFQRAEGLTASGALDATTRARLIERQREHVRKVQTALKETGQDPGPIDGVLGGQTKAALRRYAAAPPPTSATAGSQLIEQFRQVYGAELQQSP